MNEQIKQLFDTDTLDQFMEKAGFWIRRSDKSDEDIAEWVKYAYESPLTHRDDFLPIIILCQLSKNEGIFWRKQAHYLEVAAKTLAEDDRYDPIKYLDLHAGELNKNGLATALSFESIYFKHKLGQKTKLSSDRSVSVNPEEEISIEEMDAQEGSNDKKALLHFGKDMLAGFLLGVLLMLLLFLGMKAFGANDRKEENQNVAAGSNNVSVENISSDLSSNIEDTANATEEMLNPSKEIKEEDPTESVTDASLTEGEHKKETSKKKDKKKDKENEENNKENEKATLATVYCKDPRVVVRTGPSKSHKIVASVMGNQTLRIKVGNVVKDDSGNDEYSWREVYLGEYAEGEHENVDIRNTVSPDIMYYIEDSYIKITMN